MWMLDTNPGFLALHLAMMYQERAADRAALSPWCSMDTGVAIIVTGLWATIGWYYTGRVQRTMSRRQHTYNIITRQHDDKRYEDALNTVRAAIKSNSIPTPVKTDPSERHKHIDYFLNYFEFLSAAILCGDIDEKMIKAVEYSKIVKVPVIFREYIDQIRVIADQPTMYENIDALARRWNGVERPFCQACCGNL